MTIMGLPAVYKQQLSFSPRASVASRYPALAVPTLTCKRLKTYEDDPPPSAGRHVADTSFHPALYGMDSPKNSICVRHRTERH
jgi:hypothetical protein